MELTCGSIITKILKKEGVKYVFGVPGGQLFPFMEAVSQEEGMEHITTRHEENAAHMADAVSRLTGILGVCYGTTGPGATNLLPGVAAAYGDNIPLLAITANNQTYCTYPFIGSLQDGNNKDLYGSITKWNAVIHDWNRVPELVHTAIRIAYSGTPGPVHLDIPANIMFKKGEIGNLTEPENYRFTGKIRSEYSSLEKCYETLRNARRPLLIAGGGVVRANAHDIFYQFIQKTGIPATTTPMGIGSIPANDDSYFGSGGWLGGDPVTKALAEADVVLAIGSRFSSWVGFGRPPFMDSANQKIIHVDINPEKIGQNTDIFLGIVSDAKLFLQDLLSIHESENKPLQIEAEWLNALRKEYKEYYQKGLDLALTKSNPMNQATFAKEVAEIIDEDAIVTFDGGQAMEWASLFVKINHPSQRLFVPGMGHLGFGQPFANAAKLCFPDRQVVNLTGDGSYGCTMQELEVATRYNLPIINVISNDKAWGMIKLGQCYYYDNPSGVDFCDTNYAEIAKGFGAYGERVEKVEDLKPALDRAIKSEKPAVIDVLTKTTPVPIDKYWVTLVMNNCDFPVPKTKASV